VNRRRKPGGGGYLMISDEYVL